MGTPEWVGQASLCGLGAPAQIQKQMLRTRRRWSVGAGAGPGWGEEHLEVMEVVFAFKGLPASNLLLTALKNIPHD